MKKRMTFVIILLIIIFGGTFGWYNVKQHFIKQFMANLQPPPVFISTTKVRSDTWSPSLIAVGSLASTKGVDVSSELEGQVLKIFFKSGEMVTKGMPLVQLDDSIAQQVLKNASAALTLNKLSFIRQLKLIKTRATSQSSVDTARANMLKSQALVNKAAVTIRKKLIRAPFSGKLGIRQVNIGQYLAAGKMMVSLQSLHPLYVNFSLPEQDLRSLHVGQAVKVGIDAFPTQQFAGKITALNSQIDIKTRSIQVQATIPNADKQLYPGLFANVNVLLPPQTGLLVIPQTAVNYSLYGNSVFVVVNKGMITNKKTHKSEPKLIAEQRFVTLGARKGNLVVVTEGVKLGDEVVTSGQLKLHPNARVAINNSVKID